VNASATASPSRTVALVVGIEKYAAGEPWNLDGPASDAIRFAEWLLSRSVPPKNILALLSPLDKNRGILHESPVAVAPADYGSLRSQLVRRLPEQNGDLLWIFWGGHGLVDPQGRRRLFTADATGEDPLNLDVDEVLAFHRSRSMPSFAHQIWLIDACQTLFDSARSRRGLPHERLPTDSPVPGRQQEVVFAAKPGDIAVNVSDGAFGLFSHEVLQDLQQAEDNWPPDLAEMVSRQRERFLHLRRSGLTRQTPTYFWYRDRDGNEAQVLADSRGSTVQPPSRPATLKMERQRQIVDALLAVPEFANPNSRETITSLLRGEVYGAVRRHPSARVDAVSLVSTCDRFPGALRELLEIVRLCAGDTPEVLALGSAIQELPPSQPRGGQPGL